VSTTLQGLLHLRASRHVPTWCRRGP